MFAVTFLGHQGWMFQTKRACILVDPLLEEAFGHLQALAYSVWPPRDLKLEAFPAVDAVVLTHEHDDHFDIPSLAKLDRAIPIFLSSRSSTAAHAILKTMGFVVTPLAPGVCQRWKDLELYAFAGQHGTVNCGDEWDTLPFLVRQTGGSGSFFSMVDIPLTDVNIAWAKLVAPEPGIVGWTNNTLDWSHMADYLPSRDDATQDCFMKLGVGHKMLSEAWGAPSATLFCAGGFSFTGDRAWMNQRVFCVDTQPVCEMMKTIYPKETFAATTPGQTFHMEANRVRKVDERTPFLGTKPRAQWPSRERANVDAHDYEPATQRECDLAELPTALQQLADALFGGALFRSLHSLLDVEAPGRRLTFALVLRNGSTRHAFEYVPTACTFVPLEDTSQVIATFECWAGDLLAVIRGELGPIALTFGRARLTNVLPQRFAFDPFNELYALSHPLRRPATYLAAYEALWARVAATPIVIKRA